MLERAVKKRPSAQRGEEIPGGGIRPASLHKQGGRDVQEKLTPLLVREKGMALKRKLLGERLEANPLFLYWRVLLKPKTSPSKSQDPRRKGKTSGKPSSRLSTRKSHRM